MFHAAIDGVCLHPLLSQSVHLVFHQRYEWGDDEAYPLHGDGRHLEGDRLSTAGRHQSESVFPGTDAFNDVSLYSSEVRVAPILLKNPEVFVVCHLPVL